MEKIFSTRLDTAVLSRIADLSKRLQIPKKAVVEKAVDLLSDQVEKEMEKDVFDLTCGAWERDESAAELVRKSRNAFNAAVARRRK